MFRFAEVFVLIVAIAWIIELTCPYLEKSRREHRAIDRTLGVGAWKKCRVSKVRLAASLESARDAPLKDHQ